MCRLVSFDHVQYKSSAGQPDDELVRYRNISFSFAFGAPKALSACVGCEPSVVSSAVQESKVLASNPK
jgi:hypothetical protein